MRRLLLVSLVALACSSSPNVESTDASVGDSGSPDAAVADGGIPMTMDAGPVAGVTDSGLVDYFPPGAVWTQDFSDAGVAADSTTVINWLADAGGFGNGRFQIDFSLDVLHADASVPLQSFTPTGDFYTPDCDLQPMPLPPGGNVEGETGYACTQDGDCHLLVVRDSSQQLFEMWRANVQNGVFNGGCLAVWDMSRVYGPSGRGDQCTSADAAGFPITPLLFNADEVAAGSINHAIRFILPNSRIRHGSYLHPATHSTGATSGPVTAPPYGAHFRLRSDFPMASLPNEAARTVARALQRYGMFMADGGTIALTAQADTHTTAKWSNLLGSHDLFAIKVTDFVMLDSGTPVPYDGNCVR